MVGLIFGVGVRGCNKKLVMSSSSLMSRLRDFKVECFKKLDDLSSRKNNLRSHHSI